MASNLKVNVGGRNAMLDGLNTAIGASAPLRIYDGTQPATAGTAISTQTLLAELTGNASAWAGSASSGVLTANAITQDSSANATGTAAFFRLAGSTATIDGTVGTSGADMNLNSVSIVSGGSVSITSFTITAANS